MCYRYSNTQGKVNALLDELDKQEAEEKLYFNHASGFDKRVLPVVTADVPGKVQLYAWGLIPHWTKDKAGAERAMLQNLNARSETIYELPSFKSYIPKKRCLIPATAFFDFRHGDKKDTYPYLVEVKDEDNPERLRGFFFAGIYSHWQEPDSGKVLRTFTIATAPANELMSYVHNSKMRMPVILSKADELKWLDSNTGPDEIKRMLQPYPSQLMSAHTITKRLTSRKENPDAPEVLEPANYIGVKERLN